jgi:hypothetical protein
VWKLSHEMGKYAVRVSRYFQRNSNKEDVSTTKFVFEISATVLRAGETHNPRDPRCALRTNPLPTQAMMARSRDRNSSC